MNSDDRKIKSNGKIELESSGDIELDSSSKIAVSGDIEMANGKELRIKDSSGNKTTIKTGSQSGDLDFVLPTSAGVSGQVLKTNGSGTLSWAYSGGSGGGGLDSILSETYEEDIDSTDFTTGNGTPAYTATGTINGAISNETTSGKVIAGDKSLKYIAGSSSANDYFLSKEITLDNIAKGKTASISFYYTWGGSHDTDIEVLVMYTDSSDTGLLTSSSDRIPATSTIKKFNTTFSIPAGATAIKYGFKVADATASEELIVDQVVLTLDPFVTCKLNETTGWKQYTPTTQGFGTVSSVDTQWRRVGDSMEIRGTFTVGTPSASEARIGIPSGYTIDDSINDNKFSVGRGYRENNTENRSKHYNILAKGGTTYLNLAFIHYHAGQNPHAQLNGSLLTESSETVHFYATVPIKGWAATSENVITPAKSNLTDWISYTPDATQIGASGANETTGRYRRVGDSMEVTFELVGNGAPQSIMAVVGLPGTITGASSEAHTYTYTPDFNKIISQGTILGHWWISQDEDADIIPRGTEGHTGRSGVIIALNNADGVGHVLLSQNSFGDSVNIDANNWSEWGALANDDKIYGRFTVPILGWSAQDSNFLAALPMTKVQTKFLSSDVSGTASLSDIEFNNLTEGKYYRITASIRIDYHNNDGENLGAISFENGSQKIMQIDHRDFANDAMVPEKEWQSTLSTVFKCGATGTIRYNRDDWSGSDVIKGNGSYGETYVVLEELSMHQEVSIF